MVVDRGSMRRGEIVFEDMVRLGVVGIVAEAVIVALTTLSCPRIGIGERSDAVMVLTAAMARLAADHRPCDIAGPLGNETSYNFV